MVQQFRQLAEGNSCFGARIRALSVAWSEGGERWSEINRRHLTDIVIRFMEEEESILANLVPDDRD